MARGRIIDYFVKFPLIEEIGGGRVRLVLVTLRLARRRIKVHASLAIRAHRLPRLLSFEWIHRFWEGGVVTAAIVLTTHIMLLIVVLTRNASHFTLMIR